MANKVLNARVIDFLCVKDFESVLSLIESGVIRASEYLLEQDSGVEFTVLGSAVDVGETDAVRRLLALGADPNINYPGGVPIVNAAGLGHIQILELLLKSGANVNATAASDEECGETALMAAASHKKSLSLVKLLLDYGADPKALDGAGESAMFPASLGGD